MKTTSGVIAALALIGLAACEGGGVDLNVANTDNSTDNSSSGGGGSDTNPCATYTPPNSTQAVEGTFDGTNCVYGTAFVGATNPLLVDLTIPFITGKHIFEDSLFVGTNVSTGAAPAEGAGPTLTIAAGNTLVFQDAGDFVQIMRGAQIIADGSPTAPITFTSFTDAITGTAGANDVQQWGGIVINGNGITNNCSDAQRAAGDCHVLGEGASLAGHYGGNNNAESSGTLRYVIVKHTGFEIAPDNELNGITFNAVGSGTTVENIEAYSTFDDGIEFFGGAVNVTNYVALYVRDDSIDYSDGYVGTIQNALVIHYQNEGNQCIEGDNVGEVRIAQGVPLTTAPLTTPTVRNMTCITANTTGNTHGDSEGPRVRRGAYLRLENSIIYAGYGTAVNAAPGNDCFEIVDAASLDAAAAGGASFQALNNVNACQEAVKGTLTNGDPLSEWFLGLPASTGGANYSFNTGNFIIDIGDPIDPSVLNPNVVVLEPGTFYTAAAIVDEAAVAIITDTSGLGAVQSSDDWTTPWAFGLRAANQDAPLWFAP